MMEFAFGGPTTTHLSAAPPARRRRAGPAFRARPLGVPRPGGGSDAPEAGVKGKDGQEMDAGTGCRADCEAARGSGPGADLASCSMKVMRAKETLRMIQRAQIGRRVGIRFCETPAQDF
jgi:hypothetical protein